jgi:hypothetical protein
MYVGKAKCGNENRNICYHCVLSSTIRDMNKCNHACHVAYVLSLEVQNAVTRVKPGFKILETIAHHLLQVQALLCAYMSCRSFFSASPDKENKIHHRQFTPAKDSALIAGKFVGSSAISR